MAAGGGSLGPPSPTSLHRLSSLCAHARCAAAASARAPGRRLLQQQAGQAPALAESRRRGRRRRCSWCRAPAAAARGRTRVPTGNCRAACSPGADVAKHQGIAAHVEGAPLPSQRLGQALRRRPQPEAGGWRPAAGVVAAAAAASASLRSRAARFSPRLPSWRWSSWPALSCHARLHARRGEEWGRAAMFLP